MVSCASFASDCAEKDFDEKRPEKTVKPLLGSASPLGFIGSGKSIITVRASEGTGKEKVCYTAIPEDFAEHASLVGKLSAC